MVPSYSPFKNNPHTRQIVLLKEDSILGGKAGMCICTTEECEYGKRRKGDLGDILCF